jgi:molybdate transport system regulatory protein
MPGTPTQRPRRKPSALVPRVKVWLELEGRYAFGLGMSEILQAVERAGSIKHAAAALGKSYRHVWGRLREAEKALGRPLVEAQVGGRGSQRSALTAEGRQLVAAFRAFRERMLRAVQEEFARHFGGQPRRGDSP